jgi:N6-L-threonylcarbamoyladenine synthase
MEADARIRAMKVLGIETSCDDTAAAVVEHLPGVAPRLLSNVVAAQDIHGEFGGVVPELASRAHLELLPRTVERALAEAGMGFADVDGIAVTRAPGLLGALLVGVSYAKALAVALDRPFVGVNHIEAHLLAPLLEGATLDFPAVGAVVSGGHSEIFVVHAIGRYSIVGTTRDDAIGEAFDKVAKLLGLGFPGGPAVDRRAASGDPARYPLPRGLADSGDFDLSYSGLKTAVRRLVDATPEPREAGFVDDVCASFQAAAVDSLLAKLEAAARAHGARSLLAGGGVACNSRLRQGLAALGARLGIPAHRPGPALCADNAAMIALVGGLRLARGERDGIGLEPVPGLEDSGLLEAANS